MLRIKPKHTAKTTKIVQMTLLLFGNTSCKKSIFVLLCMIGGILNTHAQTSKVFGYVTDTNNEPLIGVSVKVEGTNTMTVTNNEGRFLLSIPRQNSFTVTFSYVGYATKKVKCKDNTPCLNVKLSEDVNQINEVVIRAKSNINAIDLRAKSGAVVNVDMRALKDKPMIDMGLALQGMVPGLMVSNTGELGKAPEIRIRGNSSFRKGNMTNEPLYVLDGKIIAAETFYNLPPQDIASIKVLKNASACALYGVKAANGVLEITSQRGYSGKLTISYSNNIGITGRGKRGVRLMNSSEKLEFERLLQNPATPGYRFSADYYNKYEADNPDKAQLIKEGEVYLNELRKIDTDWFNELIHNNIYQRHSFSLKGGNNSTTYYVSANYANQGGRMKGNDKQRYSVRLSLDQRLGKIGYMMLGVNGAYAKTNTPTGTTFDPTSLVYNLNPYETTSSQLYSYPGQRFNDLLYQFQQDHTDKDVGFSANLTLTPLAGLTLAYIAGADLSFGNNHRFTPATSYSEQHQGIPILRRGIYSKSQNATTNISSNFRATYNQVINDIHDLTLGANIDYYFYDNEGVGITGYGVGNIDSPSAINHSLQGLRQPEIRNPHDRNAQLGIGVVGGYSLKNIYDFYATYKADASSVLPKEKRWNSAWATGIGWTPTNYSFLKGNKIISALNLKASYGVTANLNGVSVSQTIGTFSFSNKGYDEVRPLELLMLYNKDLKAEQNKSMDAGLTLELFHRITFDANWYNRITEEALLDVPIATSTGFQLMKRNVGILQNNGIELGFNVRIIDNYDSRLNLRANFCYNRNKVIDLYDGNRLYTNEDDILPTYEVGKSYDMLYGLHSLGINPLTGYPVFKTPDGKEKQASEFLTKSDFQSLGHLTPPYNGGLNVDFQYKEFEMNVGFYYTLSGIRQFDYKYVRNKDNANKNAIAGLTEHMWFTQGDEHKIYPTPYYANSVAEENMALYATSRTVGSSNMLKLSMVSLRYRIAGKWLEKHLPFLQFASVGFQGSNLYTWTSFKESDPESGKLSGTLQPVFTFNMNLTF